MKDSEAEASPPPSQARHWDTDWRWVFLSHPHSLLNLRLRASELCWQNTPVSHTDTEGEVTSCGDRRERPLPLLRGDLESPQVPGVQTLNGGPAGPAPFTLISLLPALRKPTALPWLPSSPI